MHHVLTSNTDLFSGQKLFVFVFLKGLCPALHGQSITRFLFDVGPLLSAHKAMFRFYERPEWWGWECICSRPMNFLLSVKYVLPIPPPHLLFAHNTIFEAKLPNTQDHEFCIK